MVVCYRGDRTLSQDSTTLKIFNQLLCSQNMTEAEKTEMMTKNSFRRKEALKLMTAEK